MEWGSVFSTFPFVSANLEPWWLCQSWICVNQLSNNNYCSWDSKWPGLNDFSSLPIKLTLLYFPSRGQEVKLIRFVFRLIMPLEINHSSNCLPFLTFEMLLFMILLRRTRQNTLGTVLIRWNDNKLTGWAPSGKHESNRLVQVCQPQLFSTHVHLPEQHALSDNNWKASLLLDSGALHDNNVCILEEQTH